MAEIETKLRVAEPPTTPCKKTFRDIAAQVETMSARVTRSQRTNGGRAQGRRKRLRRVGPNGPD
jgi:hypothetical protein